MMMTDTVLRITFSTLRSSTVNPDDWDDDGIENELDPNPLFCDGDFFGPANILPEGANTNAYCTVSVVATGPDALVVFEGDEASDAADDISVTATLTENVTGSISADSCAVTSIRLELVAVYEAPENPCTNRHVYGVGEKVRFCHYPESLPVIFSATKGDLGDGFHYYDQFGGNINEVDKHRIYVCPIASSYTPNPTISYADSAYTPTITLVEPKSVITPEVSWEGCHASGEVGQSTLVTTNYIGPMRVSFQGIMVARGKEWYCGIRIGADQYECTYRSIVVVFRAVAWRAF